MTTSASSAPRVVFGAAVLMVPLIGLALVLVRPDLDLRWEHHPAHFWLVLVQPLSLRCWRTPQVRRRRAEVMRGCSTFRSRSSPQPASSLCTRWPRGGRAGEDQRRIRHRHTPWVSSARPSPPGRRRSLSQSAVRNVRIARLIRRPDWRDVVGSVVDCIAAATRSASSTGEGLPFWLAVPAVLLYGASAVRYLQFWRRRRAMMLLAVASAFILLAESMVAMAFARNWHLSWWEWHVLMLAAFALVAIGARISWYEERFAELYLHRPVPGPGISACCSPTCRASPPSESHQPGEVARMLNEYFSVAVPAVVRQYGVMSTGLSGMP